MNTSGRGKGRPLMLSLFVITLGLLISACAQQAPAKIETVKVGDLGYLDDTHFYIGVEKGYFAEQGIKPEFTRFRSAADMIAPLSTGELNVGAGAVTIGLFNALARGLGIKAVASRSYLAEPYDGNWYMVRSDLKDKVKTLADLKGKKFNMLSPGTNTYYTVGKGLEKFGSNLKEVDIVHLGPPEIAAAFANKAIEASIVVEPIATLVEAQGTAYKWMRQTAPVGPFQVAVIMYSEDWAKKNTDLAKRFMVAYIKGQRDYYRALTGGPNRKEVVDIAIKYTATKDPAMYDKMEWIGTRPDGEIDKASIMDQQNWYLANGYITSKVPIEKIVDDTFVDNAIKKLGKYKK
ncbi:MAG: ABC transporter substrate-binding protein [Chloroflexi bacterium]|nr:ABC transporter substrate-binding protein [Chloroflexota bacterium]